MLLVIVRRQASASSVSPVFRGSVFLVSFGFQGFYIFYCFGEMFFDGGRLLNLMGVKRFVFFVGFPDCFFRTCGTGMRGSILFAKMQEIVQLGDLVVHWRRVCT